MQNRLSQLDLLRLISIVLVMFGHYVSVGGGATSIPGIIGDGVMLPLIDASAWRLGVFETFLIRCFETQTAILGVSIFFIVTGYLMPMMLERYTRVGFLVNRFFRIVPVLVVATLVVGIFVGTTQGVTFSISSYVASWSLTYPFLGVVPIMGVLWTLVVELLFYLVSFIIGKFSVNRLLLLQAILLLVVFASTKMVQSYYLMLMANQAKYLLMIAIGSAFFLAEKETTLDRKIALVLSALIFSYLGFQIYKFGHEDQSTYANIGTHLLAAGLFLIFQLMSKYKTINRLPNFCYLSADLVYPIYLLHAAIGLGTMALLRGVSPQPYFLLCSAIAASFFLSYMIHILVERPGIRVGRVWSGRLKSAAHLSDPPLYSPDSSTAVTKIAR